MKTSNTFRFIHTTFIILFLLVIISCSKKETAKPGESEQNNKVVLSGVVIPSSISAEQGGEVKVLGKGFLEGDKIVLTSTLSTGVEYTLDIQKILEKEIVFNLPKDISSGKYTLFVKRNTDSQILGVINYEVAFIVPDKQNMTIKGMVHSQGVGVADVVVSDGIEVTKTDKNGIYYLQSNKSNGYVFISVPGNYEVENDKSAPLFYKKLSKVAAEVEQKDFSLTQVNNTKHVVIAMSDLHLANRNNDISQFERGFLQDVNSVIKTYKDNGTKVYGLTLGDITWDVYWYANRFFLTDYLTQMNKINAPVFNVMGNHDNDPYYADNWSAENAYKTAIGPTYYSFNLGNIHYVVLDNVEYLNTGGSVGVVGERNYNGKIVNDQMAWLKKDLAMIDKNTPVVVAMHIQLNNNPSINSSGQQSSTPRLSNANEFISAFDGFTNVQVLTGHTHINYAVENSASIMEHNTAAVCATWWWTGRSGYAGNHIAKDGSPGGYAIWEMENKDMKWQYKGIGHDKNYQFRAYDLNKVHITAAQFAPNSTDALLAKYAAEYATANNKNEVLINVWGYDPKWKVEVTENGTPLTVNRVNVFDPLHIISYSAKRLNDKATPTEDFTSTKTAHMFKVKAANATNTLQIKVTDRFGRVYTENMQRPKTFTYLMK